MIINNITRNKPPTPPQYAYTIYVCMCIVLDMETQQTTVRPPKTAAESGNGTREIYTPLCEIIAESCEFFFGAPIYIWTYND